MNYWKRFFDLGWSVIGLIIFLIPFAAIAIAIVIDSRGSVFFRQERIGRRGRPFLIWKFRTMVTDAPRLGGQLTVGADRRVTRVGAILRKIKADELPQLINVITGDMSLVGPRPEVPRYVAMYTVEQRQVLELIPGITDEASIRYRDESAMLACEADPEQAYIERIMPDKIKINLAYAARATIWGDFLVILRTIFGR